MKGNKSRFFLLTTILLVTAMGLSIGIPFIHLAMTAIRDQNSLQPELPGYANDVSRLNALPIHEIWSVPDSPSDAERQLSELMRKAKTENIRVSIAGARHSMGGHVIAQDGIVINMLPFNDMSLSADGTILTVQAGALWADVLLFLNNHDRSVTIMQSDNSFSVGGSLSVNVHGWQTKHPPISSSVKSFRILMADGNIVQCSREENAELFSLALGGYGLFGVILDAQLWTVPNEWYEAERFSISVDRFADGFLEYVDGDETVELAYGRLRVTEDSFLEEAILTVYRKTPHVEPFPVLSASSVDSLKRIIFRGSVGSDYGKELRWNLEKIFGEKLGSEFISRNQLLNGDVSLYTNRAENQTDIIHEYFIPLDQLQGFIAAAKEIISRHEVDLLNVTLRDVRIDTETFLRYADQDLVAVVMLFNQQRTELAETSMTGMTRELINASFSAGGRYYLPYRPHATPEQFLQAYPQATKFSQLKRLYDSNGIFSNQFYTRYLSHLDEDYR